NEASLARMPARRIQLRAHYVNECRVSHLRDSPLARMPPRSLSLPPTSFSIFLLLPVPCPCPFPSPSRLSATPLSPPLPFPFPLPFPHLSPFPPPSPRALPSRSPPRHGATGSIDSASAPTA